ncbi:hypothetical protein RISK_000681 [Rhodopirellula islandica]|uniref:Uncharacterized protein n=1 Tax=Rhodopirellula islandica TaxID=595434 RepID=A0A0J1BMC6_RHOIS|nr:hypothetical protein RISK_000681 [Rhodopirellula islandica]
MPSPDPEHDTSKLNDLNLSIFELRPCSIRHVLELCFRLSAISERSVLQLTVSPGPSL